MLPAVGEAGGTWGAQRKRMMKPLCRGQERQCLSWGLVNLSGQRREHVPASENMCPEIYRGPLTEAGEEVMMEVRSTAG